MEFVGSEARLDLMGSGEWLQEHTASWTFPTHIKVRTQHCVDTKKPTSSWYCKRVFADKRLHCTKEWHMLLDLAGSVEKYLMLPYIAMLCAACCLGCQYYVDLMRTGLYTHLARMQDQRSMPKTLGSGSWVGHEQVNADRATALSVLSSPGALLVFCSLVENMPYVLAEAVVCPASVWPCSTSAALVLPAALLINLVFCIC